MIRKMENIFNEEKEYLGYVKESLESEKEYDKYTEILEKAACTYAETKNFNGEYSVKIKTLLEEGLLNKKLKNPDTEKSISEYEAHCILIKLEENKRTCTYTKAECS